MGATQYQNQIRVPLIYKALLTQSGVLAPVATILENTLGAPIVYSYVNPGIYVGTLTGLLTVGKTGLTISAKANIAGSVYPLGISQIDVNSFRITSDNADDELTNIIITIEIYP